HPGPVPQVGKKRIKGRKPLQEPGPRALYHSVRIGARVARATPLAMAGRSDRLPTACNGFAESPGRPGTRVPGARSGRPTVPRASWKGGWGDLLPNSP